MHVNSSQIKLHLEPNIHISSIDGRRPPQSETSIRYLIETWALGIRQLLILHRLLKPTGFFPEKTLPSWEVSPFEQSVLQDTLDTTKCLNHVSAIVVKVPQLAVVLLVTPPEGILLQNLVLFKVLSHTPTLIKRKRQSVLLEQSIYARDTTVPAILEVV